MIDPVTAYARAVVDGAIPAGKYHRLACQRHLNDLERQNTAGFPYVFSWPHADQFLRFARLMKHYKGPLAGQFFEPTDVQVFRLGSLFGWRQVDTGLRRFTVSYNDLPRKHGKSFEGAIVLTYCTFFEGEHGAEGYCIATKEKQAKDIVFANVKQLVSKSGLAKRLQVNASNVNDPKTVSKAEPLGSDSKTTDGLSPHVVIVDELHAMTTRDLVDVMESATGARLNPLFFFITTHGDEIVSVWGDYLTYAQQILDGVLEDDPSTLTFFAFIAHADVGDDPFAESTWIKANPHWGGSVQIADFRQQAAKAQRMPSAAAEFKQKKLNMLPEESSQWLDMVSWRQGQSHTPLTLEQFAGRSCWLGLDLSSSIDLTALIAVFPPAPGNTKFSLLRWVWTPIETLKDRAHRDRAPYLVWVEKGYLIAQPGKSISHAPIREQIKEIAKVVHIEKIAYDKWHAHELIKDLQNHDGFSETQLVEIPQTYQGLSAASLRLEAEVLESRVDTGDCPVMRWTFSNAVVQRDGKDNIQPIKKRSRGRIDPVVASVTALSAFLREPVKPVAADPVLVTA